MKLQNIYAETTFVCPSYWLAEAFSNPPRVSYKYQYSVIPALHGTDVTAYFGPASPQQGPDFAKAFMRTFSPSMQYFVGELLTNDPKTFSVTSSRRTTHQFLPLWQPELQQPTPLHRVPRAIGRHMRSTLLTRLTSTRQAEH
jgi:carboxylesterase type B